MSAMLTPSAPVTVPNPLGLPLQALQAGLRRFTVAEYHELIRQGFFAEDERYELLDGYLVRKMTRNPPHDSGLQLVHEALSRVLPVGWAARVQSAVTLSGSEPEPDVAIVRGNARTYAARHPGPADVWVVVEVSETSLAADRADKCRLYAEAGLPEYWIVNLVDRQIEVYTDPQPTAAPPTYAARTDYRSGDAVPVVLDGVRVATIPVDDVLP